MSKHARNELADAHFDLGGGPTYDQDHLTKSIHRDLLGIWADGDFRAKENLKSAGSLWERVNETAEFRLKGSTFQKDPVAERRWVLDELGIETPPDMLTKLKRWWGRLSGSPVEAPTEETI